MKVFVIAGQYRDRGGFVDTSGQLRMPWTSFVASVHCDCTENG